MVVLAASTWGTWSLFIRPTAVDSSLFGAIVFVVMGLVPLPLALRAKGTWDRKTVGLLLAHGAFDALNVLAFFAAISHTKLAIAVLTHYLAPILIALGAPYFDRNGTRGTAPAALVALAGLVIVLEPWAAPADGALVGAALGAASAVCYAGNVFALRPLLARIGPAAALSYHSLIAAAILAPLALPHVAAISGHDLRFAVAGAVLPGVVAGFLFNAGLGRIGSARAAILTFAEPLVTVTIGALVWGEDLQPTAAIGGALVLGAGIHVARKAR